MQSSYRQRGIQVAMDMIFANALQSASKWPEKGPAKVLELYEWAIRENIHSYKQNGIPNKTNSEGTEEERQEFYDGFFSVVLEAERKFAQ